MPKTYDALVIGLGVIGSSILRELSKYHLDIIGLEKESDVVLGNSGKNSGVIHAGFNVPYGSLKAKFNIEGHRLFPSLCKELNIPMKIIGKLVVARNNNEKSHLKYLLNNGIKNGVKGLKIINKFELKKKEPNINGGSALYVPSAGIVSPYSLTIALAENAKQNGADIMLEHEVVKIKQKSNYYEVTAKDKKFNTKIIINCAGLNSDKIAKLANINKYQLFPCIGEYLILDKSLKHLINYLIYPVPGKYSAGLGIHLTPTIDGNILIGPSDEYIFDRENYATSKNTLDLLFSEAKKWLPHISSNDIINTYAGIRTKTKEAKEKGFGDYIISEDKNNFINLIGIESPGLTSAPSIAKYISKLVGLKMNLNKKNSFKLPGAKPKRFETASLKEKTALIKANKKHSRIICRCEKITYEEVITAVKNTLGVKTINGIKYRTRAGMGRCHGGYCTSKLIEILKNEFSIDPLNITLKGKNSEMIKDYVKKNT